MNRRAFQRRYKAPEANAGRLVGGLVYRVPASATGTGRFGSRGDYRRRTCCEVFRSRIHSAIHTHTPVFSRSTQFSLIRKQRRVDRQIHPALEIGSAGFIFSPACIPASWLAGRWESARGPGLTAESARHQAKRGLALTSRSLAHV